MANDNNPAPAQQNAAPVNPIISNKDLGDALKYIAFGGLLGGSLSALTGAVRLLGNQNFRKARPSDADDDTLYVVKKSSTEEAKAEVKAVKPDDMSSVTATMLAAIGAPLAAGGSFLLGNWFINRYMRSKAQKELDEAQKMFVNAQGYDVMRKSGTWGAETPDPTRPSITGQASRGTQTVLNAMAGLYSLLALGSGITTYYYLKHNYPFKKPDKPKAPKKIVYVDKEDDIKGYVPTEDEATAGYEPTEKEAAFREDNCMELAARFLCDMDKHASIASGIVHTVAAGRLREFEKAVNDLGFEQAVNITKGASARPVNRDARELATLYCTKLASFAPQFRLAVAADFNALHPYIMKEAASMSPAVAELTLDQAAHLECAARYIYAGEKGADIPLEKAASVRIPMDIDVKDTIELWIEKLAASPVVPDVKDDSSELSDGGVNQNSAKPDSENVEDTAEFDQSMEMQGEGSDASDAIDKAIVSGESVLSLINKNPGRTNRAFSS